MIKKCSQCKKKNKMIRKNDTTCPSCMQKMAESSEYEAFLDQCHKHGYSPDQT